MMRVLASLAAVVAAVTLLSGCGHAASLPGLTPARLAKLTSVVRDEALRSGKSGLTGGTVYATTGRGANRAAQMDEPPNALVYLVVFSDFSCTVDRTTLRVLETSVGYQHVNTSKLGPGVSISVGSNWFAFSLLGLAAVLIGAFALAMRRFGFGGGGPPVLPSALVLLAAAVVGVVAWPTARTLGFCGNVLLSGANIGHASVLAFVCGVGGAVALRRLRADSRYLAVGLLVAAALLGACIVLVAWDSAAYAVHNYGGGGGDMFNCPDSESTAIHHVWFVYPAWGIAIVLLFVQSVRAMRFARQPGETAVGEDEDGD